MIKQILLATLVAVVASCNTDSFLKNRFAGRYDVTLNSSQARKDIKQSKKELKKEMSKAQKEIEKEIEEAKDQIEAELGKNDNLGDALQDFMEGVGKMAEGLTELGEGLGKMGLELGEGVLKGLKFKTEFRKNGELIFGKGRSNDMKYWEIKDGMLYIWEYEDEKMAFEMKQKGADEWELIGKKVTFFLKKSNETN
jgi:hypothetical protein